MYYIFYLNKDLLTNWHALLLLLPRPVLLNLGINNWHNNNAVYKIFKYTTFSKI